MSKKDRKWKDITYRFIVSTISIFIMAFNYNLFFLRYEIVAGGASGIATICHQLFALRPATTILVFNVTLIIISYYTLGKKSTARTIIGSILYPVFVLITSGLALKLAQYINFNELVITILVSGCIYGFFNGIIYKYGYSTGGMDTLILIVNKYFKISIGSASLLLNLFIISCGAFIFGFEKAVYGLLIIAINKYMINKIQLGISDSKMFYIMTRKAEAVKKVIGRIDSGYTILNTEGGFTNDKNQMIMCVVPTMNYYMFRKEVMEADSDAFIVISDCYEVYGGHIKERLPFI